tara:strand:- start:964 stop:1878 length:915 start_codon:yes stop_codon:yes gene_type:complete
MSAARSLGNLGNQNALSVDTTNLKVGVVSTSPVGELSVGAAITMGSASGIISATKFVGDGSDLEGVASAGLGTALSSVKTEANNLIYYTNTVLGIGSTAVVDPPSGTRVAYTQYADIDVYDDADLIVADGDDFIPDILGLSTEGVSPITGSGGRIRAGQFVNNAGTGAPQLTYGAEVPVGYAITGAGGVDVSGIVTTSGDAWVGGALTIGGNLTVTGDISYDEVTGTNINISGIGTIGTLGVTGVATAYNLEVIGVTTVGSGVTISVAGVHASSGIITAKEFEGSGASLTGLPAGFNWVDGSLF